jgi:hypothetical protein
MQQFRCYFLDRWDRIAAAEDISATAVDSAVSLGLALLMQRRQTQKADIEDIEIWQGPRKVYP